MRSRRRFCDHHAPLSQTLKFSGNWRRVAACSLSNWLFLCWQVAAEVGVSASTLERWRSDALSQPRSDNKVWSAAARFDALLTTAAMDETTKNAWCRANGVLLHDLQLWRQTAAQSLADPQDQRASPS